MLPAHQLYCELVIPVPRYRHQRPTITVGKGWGICRFTHTSQACRARPRTTRHAAPTPKAPCEATAVKTARVVQLCRIN